MRTQADITSITTDAKINYSYRIQLYEADKQRGIQDETWSLFFSASNVISAIDSETLSLSNRSLLCDWLIRNDFVLNHNNLLFTEDVYTDSDYDTV